jgi:tetratricopeptide (TPR) repeat protein
MDNLVAFECYLKARHQIWSLTEEALDEAHELLKRGLAVMPDSGVLLATRAVANCQYLNFMCKSPSTYPTLMEEARGWATRAVELDPESSVTHHALGSVDFFGENPPGAVANWVRAVQLNPSDSDSLHWLGFALFAAGRELSKAKELLARAARMDPLNPLHAEVSQCYPAWYTADFGAVLEKWKTWRRLADTMKSPLLRLYIGYFHAASGDLEEASRWFDNNIRDAPGHPAVVLGAFLQRALGGDSERALETVTPELEQAAWWDDFTPVVMAGAYALIGEREQALRWVDRATVMGTTNVAFLGEHEPFLKNLHGDAGFEALLKKAEERSAALTSQTDIKALRDL